MGTRLWEDPQTWHSTTEGCGRRERETNSSLKPKWCVQSEESEAGSEDWGESVSEDDCAGAQRKGRGGGNSDVEQQLRAATMERSLDTKPFEVAVVELGRRTRREGEGRK